MWLILVDRSASDLDAVKDELARRLGASDTVAFFSADQITHSFEDGPAAGPADIASALRWAAGTLVGEERVLVVSELRNTLFGDELATAARALQDRCPVDVLLLGAPGYQYWVAERIASGRVVTATSALELGPAMTALLGRPDDAGMPLPLPISVRDGEAEGDAGHPPDATGSWGTLASRPEDRAGGGLGAIGAAAAAATRPIGAAAAAATRPIGAAATAAARAVGTAGSAIGRLARRRRTRDRTHRRARGGKLEFTVAHPSEVVSGRWHTLVFVLHRSGLRDKVDAILQAYSSEIGEAPSRSETAASTPTEPGTVLTLVPDIPGVACVPERTDVTWHDDVQETTFSLCAEAGLGVTRAGSVEVYVGPLLLAVVPIALRVLSADMLAHLASRAGQPSSQPSGTPRTTSARMVDRVFASYARRDAWIVDACAAAYRALGVEVVIDRTKLRSGQDWRATLRSLISGSDLFQLYWSEASAASAEVEGEWRFAHSLTDKGPRFIRPLFWETPMPLPPMELSHLHFSRIALDEIGALPGGGVAANTDRRPAPR
jgi:hypothetical protein